MVKRKIVWSKLATQNLLSILEYFVVRNYSSEYSRKLNKQIKTSIHLLQKFPYIGFLTDVENVRGLIEGNYVIFYKIEETEIVIISIWDTRSDSKTEEQHKRR